MKRTVAGVATFLLGFQAVPAALANDHVVSPSELRSEVSKAGQERERNAGALRALLGSETAAPALKAARLDATKVDRAIALMSDAELARLAERSKQMQSDFAAGALSNAQITYIILGGIVVVIVAILAS